MHRKSARSLNFTKTAIENLAAPAEAREYHYDLHTPGLAMCVTPAGTKTFYAARRIGRKWERIRLGGWPELTVYQARDAAARSRYRFALSGNETYRSSSGDSTRTTSRPLCFAAERR